jgi:hypothetical protein
MPATQAGLESIKQDTAHLILSTDLSPSSAGKSGSSRFAALLLCQHCLQIRTSGHLQPIFRPNSIHPAEYHLDSPVKILHIHPHKVMPMCSRLLRRLPSNEIPGLSPIWCVLLAVRACLLVLLCRAPPTNFFTHYLPYPTYPVVPIVRHTRSTRSCTYVV